MNRILVAVALAVCLALTACSEAPAPQSSLPEVAVSAALDAEAVKARGAEILLPFKQQLMQALQQGMAEGPVQAIDVCRVEAPAIAASLGTDQVTIGRASHRPRNPANAPVDWQQGWLNHYLGSEDRAAGVTDLGDGRVAYVEPIMTAPLCLACHGAELAGDVQDILTMHYPDDQATGFDVGELRGIFWVTFTASD
jgi:hypothetical protein